MKNITPRNYWQLVEIARHSFRALQTWEVELAITHSTGARLQSDWEGVVQTQDDYQTSKSVYHETVKAKVAAQRRAFKLLMVTRDLLRQDLGTHYSRLWDQVGFFNCTLKIPVLAKQQIAKLSSLKEFFLLNPAAEVAGVASAARAAAMHEELSERVGEVATARRVQRQRKIERNAGVAALRQRVKQLYAELKIVLPLDDPRWLEFGFNIPGRAKHPIAANEGETIAESPNVVGPQSPDALTNAVATSLENGVVAEKVVQEPNNGVGAVQVSNSATSGSDRAKDEASEPNGAEFG